MHASHRKMLEPESLALPFIYCIVQAATAQMDWESNGRPSRHSRRSSAICFATLEGGST